jgi:hypothetical protein
MKRLLRFAVILSALGLLAMIAVSAAPAQVEEPFTLGGLLEKFWNDGKVDWLVLAVVVDFVLGVLAALKLGTFRLSYVADFLRKDVIFKLGGYLVLYAGAVYAGEAEILGIPEFDPGLLAGAAYAVVAAAFVGSILNSLRDLGLVPGVDPPPPPAERDVKDMLTADEGI